MFGRRGLFKLTAGAGVAAFGMASSGLVLPMINIGHAAEGAPLVEPEVRTSRDGLLDTTIEASVAKVPVAGGSAIMSVYEGSIPGPTLRVRPGDTLRINLVNKLDVLPAGLPADNPFLCTPLDGPGHGDGTDHPTTCDTNLHTHGFHVSPSDNSDNVFSLSRPVRASSTSTRSPLTILPASTTIIRTCTAPRTSRASAAWQGDHHRRGD